MVGVNRRSDTVNPPWNWQCLKWLICSVMAPLSLKAGKYVLHIFNQGGNAGEDSRPYLKGRESF